MQRIRIPDPLSRTMAASTSLLLGLLLALASPSLVNSAHAQPRLDGFVNVDLRSGGMSGDVCLSGIPLHGETGVVVLNRAFNVEGLSGAVEAVERRELEPGGAAYRYRLTGISPSAASPGARAHGAVCLTYSGTHPVYDFAAGQYRDDDESSVIAFGGGTVRARGASRWYPTPFDPENGVTIEDVAFDLNLRCEACSRIYINGGEVAEGGTGRFISREPRELFLIAGDLPLTVVAGSTILGVDAAPDSAAHLISILSEIQAFYESHLGIPFGEPPVIVHFNPVRAPRPGLLWGFLSDPALGLSGMTIGGYVRALSTPSPAQPRVFAFLAHELAHRYFGWGIGGRSAQRDLFGEPFATQLEFTAVKHFHGESAYAAAVRSLHERAASAVDLPSLDRAGPDDLADPAYRYGYAPLVLLSLERTIGEERFLELLRRLILSVGEDRHSADYMYVRRMGLLSGVTDEEWARWEAECVKPPMAENACLGSFGRR